MEALFFPTDMANAVAQRLGKLKDDISQSISQHGLVASGRTQSSMYVVVTDKEVTLYGRPFFPALETGSSYWTGATGISCTFEQFRSIIKDWVIAKGLHFGQHREQERVISAITMSIIRKGTKQKRKGARLDVYTTLVDEAFNDCGNLVLDVVNAQVNNVIAKWKT